MIRQLWFVESGQEVVVGPKQSTDEDRCLQATFSIAAIHCG